MSYGAQELLKLASDFDNLATKALVVEAKKKENKKLDPKAKVRNRGTVCVPAESAKDKKDHFPINNEAQARNALARVNQYSSAPEWYSGSLQSLVNLVARKVKSKYPSIEVSKDAKKPGKKKASEYYDHLLAKFADGNVRPEDVESSKVLTQQRIQSINSSRSVQDVDGVMDQVLNDFRGNQIDGRQYSDISAAAITKKQSIPQATPTPTAPVNPEQKYWDDKAKYQAQQNQPASTTSRIPYNKNVEIAQQQLANMGGYDLGTSGRYGNGVDGQLGGKTIAALKQYNPQLTPQQAIAELVQKYNAGPEFPKEEAPPLPKPEQTAQNAVKTWGG